MGVPELLLLLLPLLLLLLSPAKLAPLLSLLLERLPFFGGAFAFPFPVLTLAFGFGFGFGFGLSLLLLSLSLLLLLLLSLLLLPLLLPLLELSPFLFWVAVVFLRLPLALLLPFGLDLGFALDFPWMVFWEEVAPFFWVEVPVFCLAAFPFLAVVLPLLLLDTGFFRRMTGRIRPSMSSSAASLSSLSSFPAEVAEAATAEAQLLLIVLAARLSATIFLQFLLVFSSNPPAPPKKRVAPESLFFSVQATVLPQYKFGRHEACIV
jgi:hypothetical protein